MVRRSFVKSASIASLGLLSEFSFTSFANHQNSQLSIGIVADAHQDIMHDAEERLSAFIDQTLAKDTDFNIQLGDFCEPKMKNKPFLSIWNEYKGPKYHVLGNHDMDSSTKAVTRDFWEMPANYYSFDFQDFHFIVLDANYLNLEGQFVDYSKANFYIDDVHRTWVNPAQLEWLEADLKRTPLHTVVFVHQGLASDAWGIKNRTAIQQLFEAENERAGFQKVIACFNGHNHVNFHRQINEIHYIDINSLSYQWLGAKYACYTRYSDELYQKYPALANLAPYADPLFAILTLHSNGTFQLEGIQSKWLGPSPEELGLPAAFYGVPFHPGISDRSLSFGTK